MHAKFRTLYASLTTAIKSNVDYYNTELCRCTYFGKTITNSHTVHYELKYFENTEKVVEFSKLGRIHLGPPQSKPSDSYFAWQIICQHWALGREFSRDDSIKCPAK